MALVGEKLSTNKALATKTGRGFVGCASHLFNLAVQDIIAGEVFLVDCDPKLLEKLRNLIPSAKLRDQTPLKPLINNKTWWS